MTRYMAEITLRVPRIEAVDEDDVRLHIGLLLQSVIATIPLQLVEIAVTEAEDMDG